MLAVRRRQVATKRGQCGIPDETAWHEKVMKQCATGRIAATAVQERALERADQLGVGRVARRVARHIFICFFIQI